MSSTPLFHLHMFIGQSTSLSSFEAMRVKVQWITEVEQSSSSDPGSGSAIEGFRQKIPLHNQLTDLALKLGDFAIAGLVARSPSRLSQEVALPLPCRLGCMGSFPGLATNKDVQIGEEPRQNSQADGM